MSFEALRKHAESLPGATTDVKWEVDWVASVGGKMFFVAGPWPAGIKAVSFKVEEHRFLELTDRPGIAPAPYLARVKWVQVQNPRALPLAELKALVNDSHRLVLAGLPKKSLRQILG
jgi:predicted DNA-binding protein (MmcQ/YjbR family)